MLLLTATIFFLINAVWSQDQANQCDKSGIENCLKPIRISSGGVIGQAISDAQLDQFCSNLSSAKTCYEQKAIKCTRFDLFEPQTIYDVAVYVCGDGKNGLKGMQACLNGSIDYMYSFSNCSTQITNTLVIDFNVTGSICKYNNAIYSCYVNASKICNSDVFMTNVYKKLVGKSLELTYGCDLNNTNWETRPYSQCNMNKLLQCTQMVSSTFFMNPFDFGLFSATGDEFNRTCSMAENASACISKNAQCDDTNPAALFIYTTIKSVQYICSVDRLGYDKLVKCASNWTQCINVQNPNCSSSNAAYKCAVESVKKSCGNATFIKNYLYKLFQPTLNFTIGCNLALIDTNEISKANGGNTRQMFILFVISFFIYWKFE